MEGKENNANMEHQNGNTPIVTIVKHVPVRPPGSTLLIPPSATVTGGSTNKIYVDDDKKIN